MQLEKFVLKAQMDTTTRHITDWTLVKKQPTLIWTLECSLYSTNHYYKTDCSIRKATLNMHKTFIYRKGNSVTHAFC